MTSPIGAPAPASSLIGSGSSANSNWIADTITAIKNEQNEGGLLGMLDNAGGDGSINSFLGQSSNTANAFATISQTSITNAGSLIAQIACEQSAAGGRAKSCKTALDQSAAQQQMVQPKSMLDPVHLFPRRIDDRHGQQHHDRCRTARNTIRRPGRSTWIPRRSMQLGNGAYLNTKTNIMTMADGTQIDTITGLTVSSTT